MSKTTAGGLSLFGTLIVVLAVGAAYGDAGSLWNDIRLFLTGHGAEIGQLRGTPPPAFIGGGLFLAGISAVIGIVSIWMIFTFLGKPRSRMSLFSFKERNNLRIFRTLFLVVLLEELFARGLFLGLLRQVPALSGPVGLYFLFFLGNGLWALLHLGNYFHEEDKHPMRVLPQFLGGVLDTVAFLRWGLVGSILVHFTHNAIFFAAAKQESVGKGWLIQLCSSVLLLGIAAMAFDERLADLGPWLAGGRLQPIPGWTIEDYVWMMTLVTAGFGVASLLLLYDQPRLKDQDELACYGLFKSLLILLFGVAVVSIVMPLAAYVLYRFVGLFTEDMTVRIAGACLLMALFGKADSLSRAIRGYWSFLTMTFLFLCLVATLGIGAAMRITFLSYLILLPLAYVTLRFPAGDEVAPEEGLEKTGFTSRLRGRRKRRRF